MKKNIINTLFQFLRFLLFGTIAIGLEFILFVLLNQSFGLFFLFASGISFIAGAAISYLLNSKLTFKEKSWKGSAFSKYLLVNIGGLLIDQLILIFSVGVLFSTIGRSLFIAKLLAISGVAVYSFVLHKYVTFS